MEARWRMLTLMLITPTILSYLGLGMIAHGEEAFAVQPKIPNAVMGNWVPSASFLGLLDWERVGYYMGNAGDVNGDGCEDFLIGTFHNRQNGYDAGATYLILGNASNIWGYKKRLEYADARFLGQDSYDAFGYYVAGNGDVNGDGYDDFLIGAPAGNEAGGPKPGHAFLFLGKPKPNWGYDCVAKDRADASFVGRRSYDHLGEAVAIIGDLNGDGLDDFIIGAPFNDDGTSNGGKVYLFLGQRSGWKRNTDIETAAASFIGNRYEGWAGYTVSAAGDVNGDGVPDFLIGSFRQDDVGGRVYLIFGRKQVNWGANFPLTSADVIFEGEKSYDRAGWSLASAGDVNNDGLADFLIGAIDSKDQAGKVYLLLGQARVWPTRINLADADASWQGERYEDQAGWSVAGLPDVNYDHCDEILIGAWHNDRSGPDAGKAYLIYGRKTGWQQNVSLQTVPDYFLGEYNGDYAGYCVAGNDANGDGLGDLWVSASYNSDYRYRSGKIYAFFSERTHVAVAGQVKYAGRAWSVPHVKIAFGSSSTDSMLTDSHGNFQVVAPSHQDLCLAPSKDKGEDFDPNSIIAYDAALALQAAVGLIQLDSLQYQAADVDQDGHVHAYDAALIARYVVGYQDEGIGIGEWRFDPPRRCYSNIRRDLDRQDFGAIIVGDVHRGWQPPDTTSTSSPLSKFESPTIEIAGSQLRLPVSVPAGISCLSLELQVRYPQELCSLTDIEKMDLAVPFQLVSQHQPGQVRLALYGVSPLLTGGTLCQLHFQLSDSLSNGGVIEIDRLQINDFPPVSATILLPAASTSASPTRLALFQNYPNPFNARTTIRFTVDRLGRVNCSIYDLSGRLVKQLIDDDCSAGEYRIVWDGTDERHQPIASGVYLCQIDAAGRRQSFKILLIK